MLALALLQRMDAKHEAVVKEKGGGGGGGSIRPQRDVSGIKLFSDRLLPV